MRLLSRILMTYNCFLLILLFLHSIEANYESIEELVETTSTTAVSPYDHYRLPTAVRPEKYNLQIVTHLEDPNNLTFAGEVIIHLKVFENTDNITLHSQNLTIDEASITLKSLNNVAQKNCIKSTQVVKEHDYYILQTCEPLLKGDEYMLAIPFAGELNNKLRGYYKSSYVNKANKETRWLAITQFEPAAARAAFPCFDEPDFKAKFTVILGHHKQYIALSNMPLKQTKFMQNSTEWMWSEFEESVPMSTYLVAYTVNDFAYANAATSLKNKVHFRTWARPDAIDQCKYAGEVGPKVLQYYEDIFDIKFPLEKIDQIAVPDFSAGAMENWGLVTYRETTLLYAENVTSIASKQRIASVIAHELAHQWFGNLVTMKWWTDLWLNEGFATYVASLGIEHMNPEWRSFEEESVDNLLTIFKMDALKSSHPISQPIHLASEIFESFDSISYKKGSTVLRMMHFFLGDQAFREGVTLYLKTHAYGNAEQDNLWSALTQIAHTQRVLPDKYNIKRVMDSWTLQTGYPIIEVRRDYDQRQAKVSQQRYLLDAEASRTENNSCWWVPLSYTSETEANFRTTTPRDWLECDEFNVGVNKIVGNMPTRNEWVIFNVQMAGLYKVKYDEDNWNMLIETLQSTNFEQIHLINRAQLIDDALSLAWSGDQDYDLAMRLVEYLVREQHYIPWKAALENLGNVNRIVKQTPEYDFFKRYMRKILAPIYSHLNGLNESYSLTPTHSDVLHKSLIGSWACRFEVDDCIQRAQQYFYEWRMTENPDQINPVPKDLRSVVYCTAMRHGNDDDWNFLWERYRNSNVATEQKTIISALGCTREVYLLQRYLEWAFDENSQIRKQDSTFAFGSVARGEVGFHLAKDYFLSNIEFLHQFYGPDTTDLLRLLSPLANQMSSQRDYMTMQNFIEEHKTFFGKSDQGIRRALETIKLNAQWKERSYNELSRLLKVRLLMM